MTGEAPRGPTFSPAFGTTGLGFRILHDHQTRPSGGGYRTVRPGRRLGGLWTSDPKENLDAILMTQRRWTSPSPPDVYLDFRTSVYQATDN